MMRGRREKLTNMRSENGAVRNSMDTKIVSQMWWSLVLRGALAVLFGIVALFYTGQTLLALVFVFGFFALLNGILAIVAAVRAGEAHLRWGLLAFSGIIGVAAGLVSFIWPGLTALALVYIVASWAIITGVAEIAFALAVPEALPQPWLAGISGALSVLFGFLLAVWPRSGAVTLTWLLGIYAIAYGISQLYNAYRLRALRSDVQALRGAGRRVPSERVPG
jgi:uncharacterized membrane protein HdeD (DUF308 family)